MNFLIVGISLVIVLISTFTVQMKKSVDGAESSLTAEVLSVTTEPVSIEVSLPTPQPKPSSVPTSIPASVSEKPGKVSEFLYPGSTVILQEEKKLNLKSDDSVDTITGWYEAKTRSGNYGAISFVKTNTNSNILNRLSGEREGGKVEVLIKKEDSTAEVLIEVIVSSD